MNANATFYMRVYNVESHLLRRSVESVLTQTEPNFRFIIQDNGSTDGSEHILKEYAQKDNRIVYFRNRVNSQVTVEEMNEREVILYENFEAVNSRYFAIIDSDDYYEPEFLKKCMEVADEHMLDIVYTGYKQEYIDGSVYTKKCPPSLICNTNEIPGDIFEQEYPMFRTLWATLYSAKLWRRYWMLLDVDRPAYMRSGLDTYINMKMLMEIDRFASISDVMYTQTLRPNSIYKGNVSVSRIREADDLFLLGIEVAKRGGILNEQSIIFLTSVYYYYIEETIKYILLDIKQAEHLRMEALEVLRQSPIFSMLSEKSRDLKKLEFLLKEVD